MKITPQPTPVDIFVKNWPLEADFEIGKAAVIFDHSKVTKEAIKAFLELDALITKTAWFDPDYVLVSNLLTIIGEVFYVEANDRHFDRFESYYPEPLWGAEIGSRLYYKYCSPSTAAHAWPIKPGSTAFDLVEGYLSTDPCIHEELASMYEPSAVNFGA